MKESDLSPTASAWLPCRSPGCEMRVYAEVPWGGGAVDLIGATTDHLYAVELKRALSHTVMVQAWRTRSFALESWCVVGSVPRADGIKECSRRGLGLASVVNGSVRVLLEPKPERILPSWQRRVRERLEHLEPGGVGGKENLKGCGPAQEVWEQIQKLREERPDITWKTLYSLVPSHYMSAKDMKRALAIFEKKREFAKRRAG